MFPAMGAGWGSVVAVSALAVGGGAVAGVIALDPSGARTEASVVKVIDGDTIDVRYDARTHRVRLLNIDTPERGGPGRDGECLADVATSFVRARLAKGDTVQLEWDEEHHDRYRRELRGVYDDEGLVNAAVVRAGLAVPMYVAPNQRYRAEVEDAHLEAARDEVGLFDPDQGCTLPARQERMERAVVGDDPAAAYAQARALQKVLGDPRSFAARQVSPRELRDLLRRLKVVVSDSRPRPAPRTPTSATPAPAPDPAPAPAPQPTPQPAPQSTTAPPQAPVAPRPGNAAPCRSYAPGGKTFTYIDCDTKLPL